jgi:hypothetical protein
MYLFYTTLKKSKKLVVKEKSILIKLEEGNIFIREDIIKEHSNEFKDQKADCFLTMKATVLVKILQEKLRYVQNLSILLC